MCTSRGGAHVNHVADAVVGQLLDRIKKRDKSCKNIKPVHVKNQLWVFVNALIENPAFDSQTKETLTTAASKFGSSFAPPEALLKKLMSTNLVERLSSLTLNSLNGVLETHGVFVYEGGCPRKPQRPRDGEPRSFIIPLK